MYAADVASTKRGTGQARRSARRADENDAARRREATRARAPPKGPPGRLLSVVGRPEDRRPEGGSQNPAPDLSSIAETSRCHLRFARPNDVSDDVLPR